MDEQVLFLVVELSLYINQITSGKYNYMKFVMKICYVALQYIVKRTFNC